MSPISSLISPEGLLGLRHDANVRIADVRWWLADPDKGRRDYAEAHVPGAVFVDVDRDLVACEGPGRHPLPSPEDFARRMAALGFGDEHEVVCYDDAGGTIAARLWWMLESLGHHRVRVLDGGLAAWIAAGGPVSGEVPRLAPATLHLRDAWTGTIEREALLARIGGDVTILDARAAERYRGDVEPIDPVAGHIPAALSRPAAGNLDERGRFLAPELLRERFPVLLDGHEMVTSCGSGITACHNALAMRVAGLADPLLYPGSYSDWSSAGLPVASGDEPGTMPTDTGR